MWSNEWDVQNMGILVCGTILMSIMDDIRREAEAQGVTAYRMAKATEGTLPKSTAYRVMDKDADDVRISTLEVICGVLGLALAVRKESRDDGHERPDPTGG